MFVVEVEFFFIIVTFCEHLRCFVIHFYLHIYVDMFFHIFFTFLIISFFSLTNIANLIDTCICIYQNNVFVMICK